MFLSPFQLNFTPFHLFFPLMINTFSFASPWKSIFDRKNSLDFYKIFQKGSEFRIYEAEIVSKFPFSSCFPARNKHDYVGQFVLNILLQTYIEFT